MAFQKFDIHPLNLDSYKKRFRKIAPSEQEYKDVLEWIRQLTIEKQLTERRQLRLLHDMTLFFKLWGKESKDLTRDNLEVMKENLLNDKILKNDGTPYSDTLKEGMTGSLIRYLEYRYPNKQAKFISKNNKPLRRWFIIRSKKKTPEVLTENEVKKLYKSCNLLWHKYTLAVLFDSGMRIEEFLNLRHEDIEQPASNFPYYQIDIKEEYSKTAGRKIGLYHELSTEAMGNYLASLDKKDNKERVLSVDYDAVRMFLNRLGKKALSKRVHPHMFRKSSATYYAAKLNRQQLCKRYGWVFSSDVVDVYINRAGVDEYKVKDVIFNDDLNVIKKENQELKTKFDLSQKDMESLKKRLDEQDAINSNLKQIFDELQGKKKLEANTEFLKLLFKLSGKEITASA